MRKIFVVLMVLSSIVFAQNAKVVEVVSENIIKVEDNGVVKNIHLSGIELFAKANNHDKNVGFDKRDELKKEAIKFISGFIKKDATIKYHLLAVDEYGVEKVWMDTNELNYQLVRQGYAVVDTNDKYLPTVFRNRMTIAMKYAQEKGFGLWKDNQTSMMALVDTNCHMCGWTNGKINRGTTRMDIVNNLKARLPKSARMMTPILLSAK